MSLISEVTSTVGDFQTVQGAGGGKVSSVLVVPDGLASSTVLTSEIAVGSYLTAAMSLAAVKLLPVLQSVYGQNIMNDVFTLLDKNQFTRLMTQSRLAAVMAPADLEKFMLTMLGYYDSTDTWAMTRLMTSAIVDMVNRQSGQIDVGFVANTTGVAFYGSKSVTQPVSFTPTLDGVIQGLKKLGFIYDNQNRATSVPASLTESANYYSGIIVNIFLQEIKNVEQAISDSNGNAIIGILEGQVRAVRQAQKDATTLVENPKLSVEEWQPIFTDPQNFLNAVAASAAVSTEFRLKKACGCGCGGSLINIGSDVTNEWVVPVGNKNGQSKAFIEYNYYVSFFYQFGVYLSDTRDVLSILQEIDGIAKAIEINAINVAKIKSEVIDESVKPDEVVAVEEVNVTDAVANEEIKNFEWIKKRKVATFSKTDELKLDCIILHLGRLGLLLTDNLWEEDVFKRLKKLRQTQTEA